MSKARPGRDIDIWGGPMVGFGDIDFKGFVDVR